MKRITVLLFLLLMIVSVITSCGDDLPDVSKLPDEEVIKLVSGGISDYVITRGDTADQNEIDAAILLRNAINDATGSDIVLTTDWVKKGNEASIPTKEILVGVTTREESIAAEAELGEQEYIVRAVGEKIVILGDSAIGTYRAVEYFISTHINPYTGESGDMRIIRALDQSDTYDLVIPHTIINVPSNVIGNAGGSEQDAVRLFTSLQGLINRNFPETDILFHQTYDSNDTFWLNYMMEDGNYYSGYNILDIENADLLWQLFLPHIKQYGMVAWDPAVPSTANVAATICGVDGYLPVKYDTSPGSLYTKLISLGVEEKMSLVGKFTGSGTIPDTDIPSSGSTKCDAYLWALELYMDRCSNEIMGYILDGAGTIPGTTTYEGAEATNAFYNQIYNFDYFVMKKAFCFDLTSNAKEAPFDDPTQPVGTDYETMCKILQAAYDRNPDNFTQVVGFPPWWMKYTEHLGRGNIGAVALEWQFAQLASTYNCAMEADCAHPCCMTNASLYCYFPLADSYENNYPSEMPTYDEKTRYFTVYIGDYDASAWLKSVVPGFWSDPAHGTYAMGWGFNPNLSNRIPMVFDYVYKNKADLDYFIAGDSGAGYVNPTALIQKKGIRELPTATQTWINYNKPYLERFNMDVTGFILNGALSFNTDIYDMYSKITPAGNFSNNETRMVVYNGTVISAMNGDSTSSETAYRSMQNHISFTAFRIVRNSPTQMSEFIKAVEQYANAQNDGYTYKYVGPYEYFDLVLQSGQGQVINK